MPGTRPGMTSLKFAVRGTAAHAFNVLRRHLFARLVDRNMLAMR